MGPADRALTDSLKEWKGRSDGLLAHVFFHRNANFALSTFAFAVEGWIFYSAVNSVVPQIVLNLGFQTDSWAISVRQLSYTILTMFASIPITWYATAYKDLKTPLLATFGLFLVVYVIIHPHFCPHWVRGMYHYQADVQDQFDLLCLYQADLEQCTDRL